MALRPGFRVLTHHPAWCASRRQRGRENAACAPPPSTTRRPQGSGPFTSASTGHWRDHIGRIAPARARVSSFHGTPWGMHWRRTQGEPDFPAAQRASSHPAVVSHSNLRWQDFPRRCTTRIIDEGRGTGPRRVACLPAFEEDGRLYLPEDGRSVSMRRATASSSTVRSFPHKSGVHRRHGTA